MRVITYSRVSTEEQATNGQSLDAQREKLADYCRLLELKLVAEAVDAGQSAKSLNRPGLQRALSMLRRRQADAIAVCKLDRLTRSIADWQTLIDDYFGERAGRQLLSLGDSIDTRNASGRLVLNVLLAVSQWEREAIGERTSAALQFKIRQGERCGRLRYGFDLADDGIHLRPNPAEQAVIERIKQLRQAGQSFQAIADELNRQGIPTKAGRGPWQFSAVRRILSRVA